MNTNENNRIDTKTDENTKFLQTNNNNEIPEIDDFIVAEVQVKDEGEVKLSEREAKKKEPKEQPKIQPKMKEIINNNDDIAEVTEVTKPEKKTNKSKPKKK